MGYSFDTLLDRQVMTVEHVVKEWNEEHLCYPIRKPYREANLKVSDKHTLFYALYGNPNGLPVVILHGGPGWGCDDTLTRFFDLEKWHVVMFDQRGAGRSTPAASMEENTPQNSVEDIESLREHLGIEKWMIFGGSWGSTLALLYGQAHPARCLGFILRGIFLGREQDYLHLFYGMGKVFPEAYDPFVRFIPEKERHDLLGAYHRRIMNPDPEVHLPAARAFMRFDMICGTHFPDADKLEKTLENDQRLLAVTRAFIHYSSKGFFLEKNQVLSRMFKIVHLPAIIVHGRWDAVCLPEMAYQLYENWNNSTLWIASYGGHSSNDPPVGAALACASDFFARANGGLRRNSD